MLGIPRALRKRDTDAGKVVGHLGRLWSQQGLGHGEWSEAEAETDPEIVTRIQYPSLSHG
eukprot:3611336-Rhodomonas_salina.2